METAEVPVGQRLTVLRAIDKLDKFGVDGVRALLGQGRWDGGKEGEGDFTKGAGLTNFQIDVLLGVLLGNDSESMNTLSAMNAGMSAALRDGVEELQQIKTLVAASGYDQDRIRIDPSVVRGLEYYTGPVFEAELLAEIPNEDGQIVRFGSVGGGGRYDGLVSRFRGEPVPATGFSIGVSRLMSALKALGKLDTSDTIGPVVVLVMDRDTDALGRYQRMVSDLRQAGIRAEMYLGGSGMKPQMKYADRRGAPCVVIQGGDERAQGVLQIKDMVAGAELAANIAGHEAYKEARPGQMTVPETELVATVQGILAAQRAERK